MLKEMESLAQLFGCDFEKYNNNGIFGRVEPCIKGEYMLANLRNVLPSLCDRSGC